MSGLPRRCQSVYRQVSYLLQHNLDRAVYDETRMGSVGGQSRPRQSRNAVADACGNTNVGGAR